MVIFKGMYQIEYSTINNEPLIYAFCREDDKKKIHTIKGFKPYFYIKENELIPKEAAAFITNIEGGYTSIYNDKLKKITVKIPNDVYAVRQMFPETFEADIPFPIRFLIDRVESIIPQKYRTLILDIETTTTYGFPKEDNPIENVTVVSYHDNYTDEITTLVFRPNILPEIKQKENGTIEYFDDEHKMLSYFISLIRRIDPDIITAWNVKFDIGYLVARMKVLRCDVKALSPMRYVEKRNVDWTIKGRVVFDLLTAYRRIHLSELTSYALASVAKDELGETEEKERIPDFTKAWKENLDNLIEYNRNDVILTKKINDKLDVIGHYDQMRLMATLDNINSCFFYSRLIDVLMLRKYNGQQIFPSKPEYRVRTEEEKIRGGFVFDTKKGLWEDVIVLDMKTLYPSIILTFNLSKEMITTENDNVINVNGIKIKKSHKGITPNIIEDLNNLRNIYRNKLKDYHPDSTEYKVLWQKSFASKFLVNSVSPDTTIIVKDKGTNQTQIIPIKNIEKQWQYYQTLINEPNTNELIWQDIKGFTKEKPVDKKIVKIKTKYGMEIDVSTNHSLYVLENGQEKKKRGDQLKQDDQLTFVRYTNKKKLEYINTVDYLKDNKEVKFVFEQPYKIGYAILPLIKKLVVQKYVYRNGKRKLLKWLCEQNKIKLIVEKNRKRKYVIIDEQYMSELLTILTNKNRKISTFYGKGTRYLDVTTLLKKGKLRHYDILKKCYTKLIKSKRFRRYHPILWKVNDNLLSTLGFYIAEGSIGTNSVVLTQKDDRYEKSTRIFFNEHNIKYSKHKMVYSMTDKIMMYLFEKWGGKGSLNKQLPPFYLQLSDKQFDILLNSLLKGDGHYKKKAKEWQYNSVSKKLIQQIFLRRGRRVIYEKIKSDKIIYHLTISKNDDKKRYIPIKTISIQKYDGYLYDLTIPPHYDFYGGKLGFFRLKDTVYGAHALPSFRMYDERIANTITFVGREIVQMNMKIAEEMGHTVIAADTDSVIVKVKEGEDPIKVGNELMEIINLRLNDYVKQYGLTKHYMRIEFEKHYKKFLAGAKKRYAGYVIWKDGKQTDQMEFAGYEVRRSDNSKVAKQIQRRIMTMILRDGKTQQEVFNYIEEEINKIRNHDYTYDQIALPTKLEKDIDDYEANLPQCRAATWANKNIRTEYSAGSKFMLLYVEDPTTDVIAFDNLYQLARYKVKLDMMKTLNVNIFMKIEKIMMVLGWKKYLDKLWDSYMLAEKNQTTLSRFVEV